MPSLHLDQTPLLESPSRRVWLFFNNKHKVLDADDNEDLESPYRKRKLSCECPSNEGDDGYFINDDRSRGSYSDSESSSEQHWDVAAKLTNFRSRIKGRNSPTNHHRHPSDPSDVLPLIHPSDSCSDLEDYPSSSPDKPSNNTSSAPSSPGGLHGLLCSFLHFLPWAVLILILTYMFYYLIPILLTIQYDRVHGVMFPHGLKRFISTPDFDYNPTADALASSITSKPVHIPRIVHVTYKSRKQLPKEWEYSLQQWQKMNPDWEVRFWSDEDIAEFVHTEYPEMEDMWKSYNYMIQRVDSVRYMILHKIGGLYSDLDIMPATALDKLLAQWEDAGKNVLLAESMNMGVTNAFMAAAPQSEFMKCAVDNLPYFQHTWIQFSGWQHWEVLSSAGSTYLWGMVGHCYSEGVEIMDQRSFRGCSVCDAWETGQPPASCDTEWLHHSTTNSSWHQHASFLHRLLFNLSYFFLCKPIRGCFLCATLVIMLVRRRHYGKPQPKAGTTTTTTTAIKS